MKKTFFLVVLNFSILSYGQNPQSSINFMTYIISPNAIIHKDCVLDKEKYISISYISYGIDVYNTNKNGLGCFFAIPKKEFGLWSIDNKIEWNNNDIIKKVQDNLRGFFLINFNKVK